MPVLNQHVDRSTPMGGTLRAGGATFRTWAPAARDVYLVSGAAGWSTWTPDPAERLVSLGDGTWAGFVPGLTEGAPYLFWIRGPAGGTEGFKRDPYARELGTAPPFPDCPCLLREPRRYPWHDAGWTPPPFHQLVIYQLHVGVFWAVDAQGRDRRTSYGRFLDLAGRLPYLADLGVNAVQLLPIQEYDGDFGLGYAGLDYFSPEMTYQVEDPAELARHLGIVNALLAAKGRAPLLAADIASGPDQLKCLVDLCHLHGLAVIFDLVYNHAGGGFGDRSLAYYDRQPAAPEWKSDPRSLYFGNGDHAGGLVFDYARPGVRQFLIDNARFFLDEHRIDGIRYDEVTVISGHGGDGFCRDLTGTVRFVRPQAIQIAEYWSWNRAFPVTPAPAGLGFDAALDDRLRIALRRALEQAARGDGSPLPLDAVRDAILPPQGFSAPWRAVQHLENHDIVRWDFGQDRPRELRVPKLAHYDDPRSWYARSRSRVATALLLTAPGIPLLFMGQEILEDKPWHDDVKNWARFLIWWDGLSQDRHMRDFLRFVGDLVHLRRAQPALQGDGVRVPQVHEQDRVIAVHRWVEGAGRDLVVVASFNERTLDGYPVELPFPGRWSEIFNSDYYDYFPNPWVAGNGGGVIADGPAGRTYPWTARVRIPANAALVLSRPT